MSLGTYARPAMGTVKQKSELTPLATEKHVERKATTRQRRDSYLAVERRDAMLCRCCGKPLVRSTERRLDKLEHHHVYGREIKEAEHTWNIACICRECHDKRHVTRVLRITGNADRKLWMQEGDKKWFTLPRKPIPPKQLALINKAAA